MVGFLAVLEVEAMAAGGGLLRLIDETVLLTAPLVQEADLPPGVIRLLVLAPTTDEEPHLLRHTPLVAVDLLLPIEA